MNALVKLESALWSLTLAPHLGASVTACRYAGTDIFEPARPAFFDGSDGFASSCFPLLPFSNRIEHGQFEFDSKPYQLAPNSPRNSFPIHGNGWAQAWEIVSQNARHCHLVLNYTPQPGGWPWAYRAVQIISLKDSLLSFELSLENTDTRPAPAGLGLHPFFANAGTASVQFGARAMWACDDRLIPTEAKALTPETDFSSPQAIGTMRLDNCFEGWDGVARIRWPELNGILEMRSTSTLSQSVFHNLVVYAQPENSFFCLEPVSHINNALNIQGAQITVLAPKDQISGRMEFCLGNP